MEIISWSPSLNTWYHLAFVRSGTTGWFFINGDNTNSVEQTAFSSNSLPDLASSVYMGTNFQGNYPLNGWLDELRISKGIARWTANFTPPTAEYDIEGAPPKVPDVMIFE